MEKTKSKLALVRKRPVARKAKAGTASRNAGENKNDPGAVMLNKAAKTALTRDGDKIAEFLLRTTLGGSTSTTKLLVGLADEPMAQAKHGAKGQFVSQALRLASEPQWGAENPEAAAEKAHGIDAQEG